MLALLALWVPAVGAMVELAEGGEGGHSVRGHLEGGTNQGLIAVIQGGGDKKSEA